MKRWVKTLIWKVQNIFRKVQYRNIVVYHPGVKLKLSLTAKIIRTGEQGKIELCKNSEGDEGRTSILKMENESKLLVKGYFNFMYGADIVVFKGAELNLGNNSYINSNCLIRCKERISIGENCAIAHSFIVMDSDFHQSNSDNEMTAAVYIGNHVWIGARVTILKGVRIGDGAIIAAGAVVIRDIPPRCLAVGNPARIVKENVNWEL